MIIDQFTRKIVDPNEKLCIVEGSLNAAQDKVSLTDAFRWQITSHRSIRFALNDIIRKFPDERKN